MDKIACPDYFTGNCFKCDKPYCYVGDYPLGGYPVGCEPWCTCKKSAVDMLAKEQLKKVIDDAYDGVYYKDTVYKQYISEDLKNKLYRLAYLVPHTHPDPKVEEAYKEIIDELEKGI